VLTVAILGLVCAVSAPLIHAGAASFGVAEDRVLMTQEARFALSHMARALRQARVVTAATDDGAGVASLSFLAADGTAMTCGTSAGSTNLVFGPVGAPALLSRNCKALAVRCYDAAGQLLAMPITQPTSVATVEAAVTVAGPRGQFSPAAVSTRASLLRTQPTVIINEIMYLAPAALGGSGRAAQWVELYNTSAAPVDMNNWNIWTKDQIIADTFQPDFLYSSGSTVIPPGGYALVTASQSKLYQEQLDNGDFESLDMTPWRFTSIRWQRVGGGAYSGAHKVQLMGGAWLTMYQDFKIPAGALNPRLFVRARMNYGSSAASRLVVQTTNRSTTVLVPVYDGALADSWVTYMADLTSVVGRDARLEIKTNSPSIFDVMDIDGIGLCTTVVPSHTPGCLHLKTTDKDIGSDLAKRQVFLTQGNTLRDVVAWNTAWGGNADGTTLSRVSPWAPSTEASSWKPGPYAGTPVAPN
jgi:hypothetical protein